LKKEKCSIQFMRPEPVFEVVVALVNVFVESLVTEEVAVSACRRGVVVSAEKQILNLVLQQTQHKEVETRQ